MSNRKPYHANARFVELGSVGAPFRSLINVDHITNVRFEQSIQQIDAQYDDDNKMIAPPQQISNGWNVVLVLAHGPGGQNILFPDEFQAAACYNTLLDMIQGVGAPMARIAKLDPKPVPEPSVIETVGGDPLAMPGNDDLEEALPGEVPDLTDEEVDQLENPEIDVDAIADAVDKGVEKPNQPN